MLLAKVPARRDLPRTWYRFHWRLERHWCRTRRIRTQCCTKRTGYKFLIHRISPSWFDTRGMLAGLFAEHVQRVQQNGACRHQDYEVEVLLLVWRAWCVMGPVADVIVVERGRDSLVLLQQWKLQLLRQTVWVAMSW